MKVAILSDSHDHIRNLEKALSNIKGKVDAIIHCGDLIAPFASAILATSDLPIYICIGNNDEDHIAMLKKGLPNFTWITVGQEYGEEEFDQRKVAFTHYPKLAALLANSEKHDVVFFGHTHVIENKMVGNTLLLNPGSICGIINGKYTKASYAVYDTKKNSAEIITIK